MILFIVSSFLLASLWVARVEGSSSAFVFDRFRCHGQILATLFDSLFVFLRLLFFSLASHRVSNRNCLLFRPPLFAQRRNIFRNGFLRLSFLERH